MFGLDFSSGPKLLSSGTKAYYTGAGYLTGVKPAADSLRESGATDWILGRNPEDQPGQSTPTWTYDDFKKYQNDQASSQNRQEQRKFLAPTGVSGGDGGNGMSQDEREMQIREAIRLNDQQREAITTQAQALAGAKYNPEIRAARANFRGLKQAKSTALQYSNQAGQQALDMIGRLNQRDAKLSQNAVRRDTEMIRGNRGTEVAGEARNSRKVTRGAAATGREYGSAVKKGMTADIALMQAGMQTRFAPLLAQAKMDITGNQKDKAQMFKATRMELAQQKRDKELEIWKEASSGKKSDKAKASALAEKFAQLVVDLDGDRTKASKITYGSADTAGVNRNAVRKAIQKNQENGTESYLKEQYRQPTEDELNMKAKQIGMTSDTYDTARQMAIDAAASKDKSIDPKTYTPSMDEILAQSKNIQKLNR